MERAGRQIPGALKSTKMLGDVKVDETKKAEEQIVEDTDADTRDNIEDEKQDEEQIVEDTDADTKDIDNKIDALTGKIDELVTMIGERFDAMSNVMLRSGAVVSDAAEDDIVDDVAEAVYPIDEITVEDMIEEAMNDTEEE